MEETVVWDEVAKEARRRYDRERYLKSRERILSRNKERYQMKKAEKSNNRTKEE